jgi:hypothetical protein
VARTEEELRCTQRGQVLLLPGERSVFDLNAAIEASLAPQRREFWSQTTPAEALAAVRQAAGIRRLSDIPEARFEEAGRVDREGYHIDKFVLYPDSGVPLPGLTYHPPAPQDDAYLYLHEDGKLADGAAGESIEKLVRAGYVVVSVDLRGTGETASGKPDALLGEWKSFYLAYLLGQSLVGLQAEDALIAGKFVAHYKTKQPRRVHLIGVGQASVPALHAAALEPELFTSVTLEHPLEEWSSIVQKPAPAGLLTSTVHGALHVYDLPDLARTLGPDKLRRSTRP